MLCAAEPLAEHEPKGLKRDPVNWAPSGEADHTNAHEILCWSLLVVKSAASVVKLDKWAILVKSEHLAADMLRAEWKPPEHFGEYQQISAIFEPMVNARIGGDN